MRRRLPALTILFLLFIANAFCEAMSEEISEAIAPVNASKTTGERTPYSVSSSMQSGIQELIKASRLQYIEGADLIKSGNSNKARVAFNKAVDIILQSSYDLSSTPALLQYFMDLIQRIQEDESRYLMAPVEYIEKIESAVVDELDQLDLIPITADPSLRDALAEDLLATKYEIPISLNEMVIKSLDFWLNRGRKYFANGLIRSGKYRLMIEKVFREESIPLDIMYLAQVESLFSPHALSRAKAKGIWQFGRMTAIRYGLKVDRYVDERSDPEKSTRAAAHYLKDLFAMFKDWNLVLAAYNWGEGKVKRLIENTGLNDFWQLVDLRRKLPEETKNHVPLIQASVILGRNPGKYGFPTELDPPLRYSEITISKPIDLRAAAKVLSTSLEELRNLNPALRGITTPANYPDFQLKVPADSDPKIHEQVVALPETHIKPSAETARRYKIKPGDTLGKIASKNGVSVQALEKTNKLISKKLAVGMWIQMPEKNQEKKTYKSISTSSAKSAKLQAKKITNKKTTTEISKNKRQSKRTITKIPSPKLTKLNKKTTTPNSKTSQKASQKQTAAK